MKTNTPKGYRIPAALLILVLALSLLPVSAFAAGEEPAGAVTFTFTDADVAASGAGEGYEIEGTALKITAPGVYTLTGSCAEGSVTVKKGTAGVTLVLKNLSLSASSTAPLVCGKESEVTLYLAGTSTLTDNEDIADEDSEDFEGAAVKVKSGASLTVEGTGTLNVLGNPKNGVKGAALATVTIKSGTVNITAENHGLACDNEIVIDGGTLNVTARNNEGIKASPDEEDAESLGNITVNGGTVNISAGDDGIHADGDLRITGGNVTVSAGDDGLKAEYDLTVTGGSVTVTQSYEGIEGATVNLKGGSGSVTASDDGANAANGDLTNYAFALNISGGDWYINAEGDGLDSNGGVTVTGGTTLVYAARDNGNGAMDSETGITVSGGTVLAVGMSGMAETPVSGVYVAFGTSMGGGMMGGPMGGMMGQNQNTGVSLSAGTGFSIQDSAGNTLITGTAVRAANSVILASEDLTAGETYTLYVNGRAAATATAAAGSGQGRMGQPGQMEQPGQSDADLRPGQNQQPGMPGGPGRAEQSFPSATPDDPAAWAKAEVSAAVESGLVPENLRKNYQGTVTRGEVARMFVNLIELAGGQDIGSFLAARGLSLNEDAFTDTEDPAVLAANALGILRGMGDGTFAPDAPLTRAQLAAVLNRVAGVLGEDTSGYRHGFTDVAGHWAEGELGWAFQKGILRGRGDGSFDPNAALTTQEAIAVTYRALGVLG